MDLNVMMREQAKAGLERELADAVTNGDTEAAKKVTDKIAALAVASAPAAQPYGQAEIRAELEKAEWFGVDPEKSAVAMEFGKTMNLKKFATAADFAKALIAAVDKKFVPAPAGKDDNEDPDEDGDGEGEKPAAGEKKPRKTDGPGEGDETQRGNARGRSSGPWTKLADAPADVQREIKRAADKFVASTATKEQREGYIAKALESHYAAHQRAKGRK